MQFGSSMKKQAALITQLANGIIRQLWVPANNQNVRSHWLEQRTLQRRLEARGQCVQMSILHMALTLRCGTSDEFQGRYWNDQGWTSARRKVLWTVPDALFIVCDIKVLLGPQQPALTNDEQLLSHAVERKSKVIPKIDTQFEAPISAILTAACKSLNLVKLPSAARPAAVFVLTPRTPVIVV